MWKINANAYVDSRRLTACTGTAVLALVSCLAISPLSAAEPLPTLGPGGIPPAPPPACAAQPFLFKQIRLPTYPVPLDFEPGMPSGGRVAIVVASALYSSVSSSVNTYAADLIAHGFTPFVVTFSGTAEALKNILAGYYAETNSLAGAVLVGELPYAIWEMNKSFDTGTSYYAAEICDIFLMDLDGTWEDLNASTPFEAGRYDTRGGDLHCEIWVTRIAADNLSVGGQTETTLLNGYFARNHAYRGGAYSVAKAALHYTDYDWAGDAAEDAFELESVYQTVASRVCGVDAGAGGTDYRDNHLPSAVELIQVRCHGTATTHMWDDGVNVTSSDYLVKDPDAVFYNLYTCSGADFTTANNLSRIAVMNPAAGGLAAWSHSGTGGMITFDRYRASVFYDALGTGECLGEAFRLWYNSCVDGDFYYTEPYWKTAKWFNGMRIDGDGCLTLRTPIIRYVSTTGTDTPPYTSWESAARSVNDAFDLCGPGDIIRVAPGHYALDSTLVFDTSKAIRITGTNEDATAVLDSGGGRCIYVQYGVHAVIEYLALTGGSADYGGGARMASGILRGCVVTNNHSTYAGGGLYLDYDAHVENCLVAGNTSTRHGGGFITWGRDVLMTDTVVSNNVAGESGGGGITTSGGRYERCRFTDNVAGTYGGGVNVIDRSTRIDACVVSGNHAAQHGGGLSIHLGSVCNTLVAGNTCGTDGGGVHVSANYIPGPGLTNVTLTANAADGSGDGVAMGSNVSLVNGIVWGNGTDDLHLLDGSTGTRIDHACLGEAYAGAGDNNLFSNPLLTADYRLGEGSPCINAGTTPAWMAGAADLAGNPRALPALGAADIGAYEYTGPFGLFASPGALTFSTYETYDPAPQAFAVRSDSASGRFASCAATGAWLGVSPALAAGATVSEAAPLEGSVSVSAAGLAPGHYASAVNVRTNGTVTAIAVPVTLDILPLQTDALAFGPVASPQGTGVAFTVSLAARNAAGFTNRNHAADVALDAFAFDCYGESDTIGVDTTTTEYFLYTYYHDSRSQMVFLSSELGGAGAITNIAFYLTKVPNPATLTAFTVRLKHTTVSSFSFGAVFETTGWHTGYSADRTLSSGQVNTWVNLPINPPFAYCGTSNLMVDVCFNNGSYKTSGTVRHTATGSIHRHYHGYSDSQAGDPLLWSGTSGGPTRSTRTERPNLRFDFVREEEVVIPTRPAVLPAAAFSQGVWQGGVAIDTLRSNVILRATLGALTALSNPIDILAAAPEGPIPSAWLAQFGLPPDTDPDGNPDNDPFTTMQEYVADTCPTSGASFLRVTTVSNGPPVVVAFTPASTARAYTLQATTNLVTGPWVDVPGQGPRPGAGGEDAMSEAGGAPARFYRVKVELP